MVARRPTCGRGGPGGGQVMRGCARRMALKVRIKAVYLTCPGEGEGGGDVGVGAGREEGGGGGGVGEVVGVGEEVEGWERRW